MINTETDKPNTKEEKNGIIPEDLVNLENTIFFESGRARTYKSARGSKFDIYSDICGLYFIKMLNGGIPPKMCQQKYTSFNKAEAALIKHLKQTDLEEKADYPGSPLEGRRNRRTKVPNISKE